MTRPLNPNLRLDNTISAIEDSLLSAPDEEFLSPEDKREAQRVSALFANALSGSQTSASKKTRPLPSATKSKRNLRTPETLAFLRSLVASRPDLSPRLGAVFSASENPNQRDVEALVDELVKMGLLPKDDPGPK